MELLLYPDHRLLRPNDLLGDFGIETTQTALTMLEHCEKWNGHALAAPQVGIAKQFFVVRSSPDLVACLTPSPGADNVDRGVVEPAFPWFIANPEVLEATGTFHFKESCLSMPGVRASLVRPAMIRLRYQNEFGKVKTLFCGGLLGRVILHEMDHLAGKMFTERLDAFTKNKIIGSINKLRRKATKSE